MQKETNNTQRLEYDLYSWQTEWLKCKKHIQKALDVYDSGYNIDDVEQSIKEGTFQLWPGKQSAVVTSVTQFPRKSILNIVFSGGKMDELLEMLKELENFAKLMGCSEIRLGGRKGWKRVLQSVGFKQTNVICKKIGNKDE